MQDLDAKRILHVAKCCQGAKAAKNIYIMYQPGDGQRSCKVLLAYSERRHCCNEAKTRNRLKFAGVPQTGKPISAVSGLKLIILREHLDEILLFNKALFRLSIHALVAKI